MALTYNMGETCFEDDEFNDKWTMLEDLFQLKNAPQDMYVFSTQEA